MAKPESTDSRIATLEERSHWHRNVGWGVAGFLGAAILAIVTWWIPHESDALRVSIKADTAEQIEPMKIEMARVDALLTLKETKSVSEAFRLGVHFSEPKSAIAAVKAIAEQAKTDQIIDTQPSVLASENDEIRKVVQSQPDLMEQAWEAQLSLVDYRSFLPGSSSPPSGPRPLYEFKGPTVNTGGFTGGSQKLDGVYWRNFTFTNVQIEYDGGPLALENVRFVNCTFKMRYSVRADQFAGLVLADNSVTSNIG